VAIELVISNTYLPEPAFKIVKIKSVYYVPATRCLMKLMSPNNSPFLYFVGFYPYVALFLQYHHGVIISHRKLRDVVYTERDITPSYIIYDSESNGPLIAHTNA